MAQPNAVVRQAEEEDAPQVVDILSEAFSEDPVFNWFLRRGKAHDARRDDIFRSQTRYFVPQGTSAITEDGDGAALWLPPRRAKDESPKRRRSLKRLRAMTRLSGLTRLPRMLHIETLTAEQHPAESHYYLYAIGVRKNRKGAGIGSALLRDGLDRCDAESIPAYLENSNEKNMNFYRSHGFDVINEIKLPFGGPPMWFMWREPR